MPKFIFSEENGAIAISGFGRPFGLNTDHNNNLYVTDMDLHTIFRIDPALSSITALDPMAGHWLPTVDVERGLAQVSINDNESSLHGPHSIDFDGQDRMYINTYYTPAVHVFDRNTGQRKLRIGKKGSSHELSGPATAFIINDRIIVTEYQQNSIVIYYLNGELDAIVNGDFERPHMTKLGPDGFLYCVDTWHHRIQKLTPEGECLAWFGIKDDEQESCGWHEVGKAKAVTQAQGLSSPVAIDFKGNDMMVTDWGNDTVKVFTLSGELQYAASRFILQKPYDAIYWGSKVVIADSHNHRIIVTEGYNF